MLKGLAIQRGFHITELVLGLLLLGIAWSALRTLLAEPVSTQLSNPQNQSLDPTQLFAKVDEKSRYDIILNSGLFGAAAAYDPGKSPVTKPVTPPPVSQTTVETSLPLKLTGTTVSGSNGPLSNATIEVREKGTVQNTYYLNQEIIDRVFLRTVLPREVVLENQRTNRMETLKIDYKSFAMAQPASTITRELANSKPITGRVIRSAPVTLNRAEITKKLEEDYDRYASTVDIEEVKDDDGNTIGITTSDLESIPIAKELGFKNGDVLVSVNNEKVNSIGTIRDVVNKYQNANTYRIGILRSGQPMYFTYRLR